MTDPSVLVACPAYWGTAYSLPDWVDAYRAFTYENRGALQVDNSEDNLDYLHAVRRHGIDAIYAPRQFPWLWDTMELSWRVICEYAHDNGYDLIASIEADIIAPPHALDVLVGEWRRSGPDVVVSHRYRPRRYDESIDLPDLFEKTEWIETLGCVLFPTDLLYESRDRWTDIVERELYAQAESRGYVHISLADVLELDHLTDPNRGLTMVHREGSRDLLSGGNP